jgi:3',5'-cyclic AMP phosphodiesterase CpdA
MMEAIMKEASNSDRQGAAPSRRRLLQCMAWAGTGVLWTVSGGVPRTVGLLGEAQAADVPKGQLTFVQISDTHLGFKQAANPDPGGTLTEVVARINALPVQPAFLVHTGDISHLSKEAEWDAADEIIKAVKKEVFYIPGEHDVADADNGKAYLARYGKKTHGRGFYSFDSGGVHFIALVNVFDFNPGFKAKGLAQLGDEQLEWLEKDAKPLAASTPIVVLAHVPLWSVYEPWGWGTADADRALGYQKRFGSVTVLNGHIHQITQKVEGNMTFHTAMGTAFPQPKPGAAPNPGPLAVPADELRKHLGLRNIDFVHGKAGVPALIDAPLSI